MKTGNGDKKEDTDRLRDRQSQIQNGGHIAKSSQTVAQFLDHWMRTYAQTNTSAQTQQGYRHYINMRIIPVLGGVELQKLTGQHIQGLYASMLDQGLSKRTVLHCHRVLKGALARAVELNVLPRNPAASVSPSRLELKSKLKSIRGALARAVEWKNMKALAWIAIPVTLASIISTVPNIYGLSAAFEINLHLLYLSWFVGLAIWLVLGIVALNKTIIELKRGIWLGILIGLLSLFGTCTANLDSFAGF